MALDRVRSATVNLATGEFVDDDTGEIFDRGWKFDQDVVDQWKTVEDAAEVAADADPANKLLHALPSQRNVDPGSGRGLERVGRNDPRWRPDQDEGLLKIPR